jgi:L-fuculose-phosphate aldolase
VTESRARSAVAEYSQRLAARDWVANHEGNVSVRAGEGRFLCTPTAVAKARVDEGQVLVVDAAGNRVSGRGRPFSELGLHLSVYRARPDAGAVIHAHPPTATGFAAAGVALEPATLVETVVSLGPSIPLVPFAAPGAAAAAALPQHVAGACVCLLAGNGVIAWGVDLEQAYLRVEHVEQLARVQLVARQLGGARAIPREAVPALVEAHRKAFPASAGPPAPGHANATDPNFVRVVTEEVMRMLAKAP